MEKMEEKQAPNNASPHRQPNFLSEMKVVLGKQAQPVENKTGQGGEGTNNYDEMCYIHFCFNRIQFFLDRACKD